jgi:hypothetical protein
MPKNKEKSDKTSLLFFLSLCLVNIIFFIHNRNWIFDFKTLELFGDQRLYIELSNNLINLSFVPHVYSVGFPILLIPFLFFLKTTNWLLIAKPLILIQSFLVFPLTGALLFSVFKKIKLKNSFGRYTPLIAIPFVIYTLLVLYHSKDPLPFHLFFGLVPYSEPFAIFFLVLIYILLIKTNFSPTNRMFLLIGLLTSFLITIRIILTVILMPVLFLALYFLYKKRIKVFLLFLIGLLAGYLPQLLYNFKTYNRFFYSGYTWYWEKVQYPMYKELIHDLYGQDISSLFSLSYLKINIFALWNHYIHFALIAVMNIIIIFWARKRIIRLSKIDYFFIIANACSILYTIIYLSYWWSLYVDCIDRFLMPLFSFSLINFFYSVKILSKANSLHIDEELY